MDFQLNKKIAKKLDEMADLLQQQGANPFRIRAYRRAAETVSGLKKDIEDILKKDGSKGLIALPSIGQGIATAIAEIITTGHWAQFERLRGNLDPAHLFQTIPGIGADLASKIYQGLHIDSLEALEIAAYNGKLEQIKGIGKRRLAAIRNALSSILGRTRRIHHLPQKESPDVALLLDIDRLYLESAITGSLPLIAPKRFNPGHEAWLPILHTDQKGWHFTALYSNSALAHQLNMTRDWVVIYFYDEHHQEGQQTVVTETQGDLIGKRVIRGREDECRKYYLQLTKHLIL
ncbi:MAG: helix-hairpin-helix domain-containing protein [Sedimenticola sp.]|nr:helix-hairpin-helix domain-containing protein [Sedimenticola sp.]